MDDLVKQAMAKWPQVPDCYGWLGLDARGDWYMRDERTQAQGDFKQSKGARLQHEKLLAFIGRNYASDAQGRWFFQNGPQRVFVELEITPWVWRLQNNAVVRSHTGLPARVQSCWVDELGHVYLQTDIGVGLVHTQDVVLAAEVIEQGLWEPQELNSLTVPERFHFCLSPLKRNNT